MLLSPCIHRLLETLSKCSCLFHASFQPNVRAQFQPSPTLLTHQYVVLKLIANIHKKSTIIVARIKPEAAIIDYENSTQISR